MPENISDIECALKGTAPEEGWDKPTMAEATNQEESKVEITSTGDNENSDMTTLTKNIANLAESITNFTEVNSKLDSFGNELKTLKENFNPATSRLDNDTGLNTPHFDAGAALADEDYQLAVFIESVAELVEKNNPNFSAADVAGKISGWKAENVPHFAETTTQLTAMGQKPSLNTVLTVALEPMLRMRQWFTADRGKPVTGKRDYPIIGKFNVSAFGENADTPNLGAIPLSYVEVTQTKFGGQILITGETTRFSDIPYMRMLRRALLAALNRFHEAKGRDAMLNTTVVTGASMAAAAAGFGTSTRSETAAGSNTFAFEAAPFAHRHVLNVTNVVYDPLGVNLTLDETDYNVDYLHGVIETIAGGTNDIGGANALPARIDLDYTYLDLVPAANESDFNNAHIIEASTTGVLGWSDVVKARSQIKGADTDATVLWTDPDKGEDLLNDTQFVTGGAGMAERTVAEGAIARVGGLNLFESTVQYPGIAVAFKDRDIGFESIGSDVVTRTYVPDNRIEDQQLAAQMLNAFAVTRPEVISVIFNAGENASAAPA